MLGVGAKVAGENTVRNRRLKLRLLLPVKGGRLPIALPCVSTSVETQSGRNIYWQKARDKKPQRHAAPRPG